MVRVKFKYRDEWCRDGKWNEQECLVRSVEECKKIYGLDQCEHEILEVKEVWMFFITITDKKSKKQTVREFPTKKDAHKSAEAFRSLGFKVKED